MTRDLQDRRSLRPAAALLAAALVLTLAPRAASAAPQPTTPRYGPLIEGYAPYDGQSKCAPKAKPGMRVFAELLTTTYGPSWIGIGRDCDVGGKSEHKEGRAVDWALDASKWKDRQKAKALLGWMFETDRFGNKHAMARRLGVMYVIWNRRWWTSWDRSWSTYCVQRKRGCVSPRSGSVVHPHNDHIHFSFSWNAARRKTTFFSPDSSFLSSLAADPDATGYRVAGGNGSVHTFGASYHGSRKRAMRAPVVGIAPTPSGGGYWLAMRSGKVLPFGDASRHGRVRKKRVVDIAATPSGSGYWLLGKSGRVWAFGDADLYGRMPGGEARAVAIAPTPTGEGYWVFASDGRVYARGDAPHRGDLAGEGKTITAAAGRRAAGYWMTTRRGRVFAFGSASLHGQATDIRAVRPVASMLGAPDGNGYWILGRRGKVAAFGTAQPLGSV